MSDNGNNIVEIHPQPIHLHSALPTAEQFVELLEYCSGNLRYFIETSGFLFDSRDAENFIATTERAIKASPDKKLFQRWETAFNDYLRVKLKFERLKAFDALENIERGNNKPNEVIARFKALNGDILAGETHAVKQRFSQLQQSDDDNDTEDENELAEVMSGA